MRQSESLDRVARTFIDRLWSDIQVFVRGYVHHWAHEPGGNDVVEIPVAGLKDVNITDNPTDGYVLTYDSATNKWLAEAPTGGTSYGQAYYEEAGTLTTGTSNGPTNLTGNTLTITKVKVRCDTSTTGTVAGNAYTLGAGGGSDLDTGLSIGWTDGTTLDLVKSTLGAGGTYFKVDVYFTAT